MIRRLALALTIAAVSTSASAQTLDDPYKYFRDITKTYEAKTTPVDPNAPPRLAPAAQPTAGPEFTKTPLLTPGNSSSSNSLLDGCVITAVGRLPKADGLRVTNSSTEFRSSWRKYDFYNVLISADLNGRQGAYQWICRIYDNVSAQLLQHQ